jgi:hypothetical protein
MTIVKRSCGRFLGAMAVLVCAVLTAAAAGVATAQTFASPVPAEAAAPPQALGQCDSPGVATPVGLQSLLPEPANLLPMSPITHELVWGRCNPGWKQCGNGCIQQYASCCNGGTHSCRAGSGGCCGSSCCATGSHCVSRYQGGYQCVSNY